MEIALEREWIPPARPVVRAPAVRRKKEAQSSGSAKKRSRHGVLRVPVSQDVFARHGLVAAMKGNVHREAYSVLQASVLERMTECNAMSLGVTSPATGTGKTLTAVNLSIALATQASRRVLLLDLNLTQPGVPALFEHEPESGLEDCLYDGLALNEVAFCPSIDNLAVLPAKKINRNVIQILKSESLSKFLDTIRKDDPDRIVIADLPSVTNAESARTYNTLLDSTLLVVEEMTTKEAHLRAALAMIDKSQLLGTVLNRAAIVP